VTTGAAGTVGVWQFRGIFSWLEIEGRRVVGSWYDTLCFGFLELLSAAVIKIGSISSRLSQWHRDPTTAKLDSTMAEEAPRKEIYTYTAPWTVYATAWSRR
jgi:hypothetical protein